MNTLTIAPLHPNYADRLKKSYLTQHYEPAWLIGAATGSTAIINPITGRPIAIYLHQVLPADACERAYPALRSAARPSRNRGDAAGGSYQPVLLTGERSDTVQSDPVLSGTIGKYDFGGVCRDTSWTGREVNKWLDAQPLIRLSGRAFADEPQVRDRYDAQLHEWLKTLPEFRIPHTPFTTIAVNKNFQTAIHRDKGDLKAGMGVLTVLAAGTYSGALTVFPAYRFACDLRTRDVLIADFAGEYHGNTPFVGTPGEYERISLVMYYRTKMINCGMAA